jgi:hypothetical protein
VLPTLLPGAPPTVHRRTKVLVGYEGFEPPTPCASWESGRGHAGTCADNPQAIRTEATRMWDMSGHVRSPNSCQNSCQTTALEQFSVQRPEKTQWLPDGETTLNLLDT